MSDPRDTGAYRIAVATIGCALIVVLAGLCAIVAIGVGEEKLAIPEQLWTITSALGGGLLGLLAPSPTPTSAGKEEVKQVTGTAKRMAVIVVRDAWANRSVVVLFLVFAIAAVLGGTNESTQFQALAGASGAALIGLLAPPPGKGATEK